MKVYREFDVALTNDIREEVIRHLERGDFSNWKRSTSRERNCNMSDPTSEGIYYVFENPEATVFLRFGIDRLHIPNIVNSPSRSGLDMDEYNSFLVNFIDEVLPEYKEYIGPAKKGLSDYMEKESSDLLMLLAKGFKNIAHTNDWELNVWARFIISMFEQQTQIDDDTLSRLLEEDLGFADHEEVVERLVSYYEFGRRLLHAKRSI